MTWRLELCDALDLMASLEAGSVDALITDPPYGTTALEWDKPVDWPRFWTEARRVCKREAPMVLFSAQPFTTDLINSNRCEFRYDLVWRKTMPVGFLNAARQPLRTHETVLVFSALGGHTYNPQKTQGHERKTVRTKNAKATHYGAHDGVPYDSDERFPGSVLDFSNGHTTERWHPTQKPLELMAWLVQTYSNADALVFDPFSGGGTTGAACLQTGRRFIGSELSPEYHALASDRLAAIACQPSLFGEEEAA